ncbi:DUF4340 domain-containing protein [Roseivirga sp. BDSF3-8]|uniref:DUF4340 domain-containing protein n=1 Tax=Roseivirga sp. BDSF3-8 TaxID=3241598 RepID=UPI00353225E8
MNRRQTNMRLLVILGVLIAAIMVLVTTDESRDRVNIQNVSFAVPDTGAIRQVTLFQPDDTVRLERTNSGWQVNGQYPMDANLSNVLLSLLSQVSVQRPVASSQAEEIRQRLDSAGVEVQIITETGEESRFITGGNATQTLSYFLPRQGETPYVVYIPGYDSYVSGLFTIPTQDWRNKTVLNAGPRELQRMAVRYPENPGQNFEITIGDEAISVSNVQRLDTAALFNYLQRATFFEADNYVQPGANAAYDSLARTEPYAIVEIYTLSGREPQQLKLFYRLDEDGYFLGETSEGELVRIQARRLVPVLRQRDFFEKDR